MYIIYVYLLIYVLYIKWQIEDIPCSPFSEPLWCQALQVNASNSVLRCYLGMAGVPCIDGRIERGGY
jgi:hypothetical protein